MQPNCSLNCALTPSTIGPSLRHGEEATSPPMGGGVQGLSLCTSPSLGAHLGSELVWGQDHQTPAAAGGSEAEGYPGHAHIRFMHMHAAARACTSTSLHGPGPPPPGLVSQPHGLCGALRVQTGSPLHRLPGAGPGQTLGLAPQQAARALHPSARPCRAISLWRRLWGEGRT